ncbi:MAG: hypothetical protein IPO31_11820 [Candidatus Obscuribacter sp.]|nr:hypothetical protein [Candidatus Obscuribacter sp.]
MAENKTDTTQHKDASDSSAGKVQDTTPATVRNEVVDSRANSPALQPPEKQGTGVTTDSAGTERLNFKPDDGQAIKTQDNSGDKTAAKSTDAVKPGDALKDGKDKLGRTPEERKAIQDYADTLKGAYRADDPQAAQKAQQRAEDTFKRLSEVKNGKPGQNVGDASPESRMKGSVAEQMNGVTDAMKKMLGPDGGKFTGIEDPAKRHQAMQDAVQDLAARVANPQDYCNQGKHYTCALQALVKTRLENDPAKVAQETASIVNNGFADVVDNKGNTMRVNVHPASMKPDAESREPFSESRMKGNGDRGLAGQAMDALAGQTHADLKAMRKGQPTSAEGIDNARAVYVTANAGDLGVKQGQNSTGEALMVRQADGSLKFAQDSPAIDTFEREHLSRTMGNKDGSVYRISADGKDMKPDPKEGFPPDLAVKTFKSAEDLHKIVAQREAETGQSTQLRVHADHLKGDQSGHGIHAITVKAAADGKFDMDNNWGTRSDSKVTGLSSGNDVIRATQGDDRLEGRPAPVPGDRDYDPAKPQPKTVNQRDYDNHRPEHFPKSLDHPATQNPLDAKDQLKDPDEKNKKEEGKEKKAQAPEELARAKYAAAIREWESGKKDGPKPDFNSFLSVITGSNQ